MADHHVRDYGPMVEDTLVSPGRESGQSGSALFSAWRMRVRIGGWRLSASTRRRLIYRRATQHPPLHWRTQNAASGSRSDAEKILNDSLRQSKTAYVSPYMIATIYAGLDDKDKAFEFLEGNSTKIQ